MIPFKTGLLLVVCLKACFVAGDSTDWINPRYLMSPASKDSTTSTARQAIISRAASSAKSGPWSIVSSNVTAPSNDPHDYLSWAPYHWPDCNWCPQTRTDKAFEERNADISDVQTLKAYIPLRDSDNQAQGEPCIVHPSPILGDSAVYEEVLKRGLMDPTLLLDLDGWNSTELGLLDGDVDGILDNPVPIQVPGIDITLGSPLLEPSQAVLPSDTSYSAMQSTRVASQNPSAAEGIQKTTAPHTLKPTKTQTMPSSHPSCVPSPSRSVPPSATWTLCPYKAHDGLVNPDVRTLSDSSSINDFSQSSLYNVLAFLITGQKQYSSNAIKFIQAFFLQGPTRMNPNLNFGQVVRGPGSQQGGYTGIVDLRGMVKVINSVVLLRAVKSPDWTVGLDQAMVTWAKSYITWLLTSDIGKRAKAAPNNHGTFYVAQLAALQIFVGDTPSATASLKEYFSGIFQNQITASGEQPLEAVRTRPFHYRCFNAEAMLVNAKLGDYLGLNLWTLRTKYGGTIQDAVNFIMTLDPKEEDVKEALPHVAAVAAAYGDPSQHYSTYLGAQEKGFTEESFWYYDQPAAFYASPASHAASRRAQLASESLAIATEYDTSIVPNPAVPSLVPSLSGCPLPFFNGKNELEVDQDIYVSCGTLSPLYSL